MDQTESGKSNMAPSKPEVHMSQLVDKDRNTISTAISMFSRSGYLMPLSRMLCDITGSEKVNMVAYISKLHIISVCRHNKNTISTAIYMFVRSR